MRNLKGFQPFTHANFVYFLFLFKFIVKTDLDKELFYEYCFICILRYAIVLNCGYLRTFSKHILTRKSEIQYNTCRNL